jgi:hypothetical protein
MKTGNLSRARALRWITAGTACGLLSLTLVIPLQGSAIARAACPPVLFLGAHGVGQGGAQGSSPDKAHWGSTIQVLWQTLDNNGVGAVGEAVSYPKVPEPLNLKDTPEMGKWLSVSLVPSSLAGNSSLMSDLTSTYQACPGTLFLLAGYSQGAWIIDYVLHYLDSEKGHGGEPLGKKILGNIKGVYLMGDPAFPQTSSKSAIEGLVNWYGSIVEPLLPESVYPTVKEYLANGVPVADFESVCAGGDPVCRYDGSLSDLTAHIKVHEQAYTSGNPSVAVDGGNWLATRIPGSVT